MQGTDAVATIACFVKLEAPDGDVRICEGGVLDYDGERYESFDAVFGSLMALDEIEAGFGDLAPGGRLVLAPNPEATVEDWWRSDLADCRVRVWMGEIDADGVTVVSAELLDDWLVDTIERQQSAGSDLLAIETIGRAEKLFLKNEGNVCSQRFHQTVYAGEKGFNNCVDVAIDVPWGTGASS